MTEDEIVLISSFMRASTIYAEFGAGGSTVLAASLVREDVVTTDSDPDYLERVRLTCSKNQTRLTPFLIHADIGPTQIWGHPLGNQDMPKWQNYYDRIWQNAKAADADLFLVDGRFRVACAMTILLNARLNPYIAIHDFENREEYHVVLMFLQRIAVCDSLAMLTRRQSVADQSVMDCLRNYAYNPT